MNKPYRLLTSHEADLWMKAAWLRVTQIQQQPRQVQAAKAAHIALDSFLSTPIPLIFSKTETQK